MHTYLIYNNYLFALDLTMLHLFQVTEILLSNLGYSMWTWPQLEAMRYMRQQKAHLEKVMTSMSQQPAESTLAGAEVPGPTGLRGANSSRALLDISFDADKMLNCSIENGQTLVHGAGGRGYGVAGVPVSSGCYQWKVSSSLL